MGTKIYFRIYITFFVPCCLIYKVNVHSEVFIFLEQPINGVNTIYIDSSVNLFMHIDIF